MLRPAPSLSYGRLATLRAARIDRHALRVLAIQTPSRVLSVSHVARPAALEKHPGGPQTLWVNWS